MEPVTVNPISFADIEHAPTIEALLAEYGAESAIDELRPHAMQPALYRQMESSGALHILGAFKGGELIGLICLIVAVLPHFGKSIATTESFFVRPDYRKTGAGIKLLREAEAMATRLGAVGLFVSAPIGGRLAQVLPCSGYRQTNQVFFRGLQ